MDITLRPACYNCKFADLNRRTDITIGDFWGIEKSKPGFADDKGVSLMFINTRKGKRLFSAIQDSLEFATSAPQECLQSNLVRPTPPSPLVDAFWKDYERRGIGYVLFKYTFKNRVKRTKDSLYRTVSGTRIFPYLRRLKRILLGDGPH
jgi:hypothetical protein